MAFVRCSGRGRENPTCDSGFPERALGPTGMAPAHGRGDTAAVPPGDSVRVGPERRPLWPVDDTATTQEATIPRAIAPVLSCWDLGPGDRVAPGRRVVRRLGGGGAHEAFLVEADDAGGRAVAKLLRPCFAADLGRLRRLRDEGRALDRLAHPALPRRLDTTLAGSRPHLLLEHVPGPTLGAVVAGQGALWAGLVARYGSAIAMALEHIAQAGWVHLDVKPANIVLCGPGVLLDFELARPVAAAARLIGPTGTWSYMAPEQRAADAAAPDRATPGPASDVFALAVSLGQALTGRPVRSPGRGELPGAVGAVLREAMAPCPGDRPTAAELGGALGALADGRRDTAPWTSRGPARPAPARAASTHPALAS